MPTIPTELVVEEPPKLPLIEPSPEDSFTDEPAFPDALAIIARVRAATFEAELLAEGYLQMSSDLNDWSDVSLAAQAETLPPE